jgi:thiol-disulfide isomerase/thioredoxin
MFGRVYQALVSAVVFLMAAASGAQASEGTSVLLAFSSDRCGHCQSMRPTLVELENNGAVVRRVNVTSEPELARRHGIRQTPTYVVWNAGRELTRLVGAQSGESLRDALALNPAGLPVKTGANLRSESILNAPETRLGGDRRGAMLPALGEAMPSASLADAVQRAEAATVRLRVHDGRGFGVGTGTIIDRHGEEALVLTCGHLFRETKHASRVEVDLFIGGQVKTVPGKVVDYDAEDRDIGLVVIRPGFDIAPVAIQNPEAVPQSGQSVFSFGCDHGDDPSRRDTRITGINKYNQHIKSSNIEIAGAPVDGRSGGGLFDQAGRLIGVCNAADYKGDVGIYTGPGSVKWQLDRVQLSHLYRSQPNATQAIGDVSPPAQPMGHPQTQLAALDVASRPRAAAPSQPATASRTAANTSSDDRLLVIVGDPNHPDRQRVITVEQPTAELMEMISRHAR